MDFFQVKPAFAGHFMAKWAKQLILKQFHLNDISKGYLARGLGMGLVRFMFRALTVCRKYVLLRYFPI